MMSAQNWIVFGLSLFVVATLSWIGLGVVSAWPWPVIVFSSLPLLITLFSMKNLAPKPFFYGALVLMVYITFAVSQLVVSTQSRLMSALVLGDSLAYLAILKTVLQALNSRAHAIALKAQDQASP